MKRNLPWFDPDEARRHWALRGFPEVATGATAPDFRDYVVESTTRFPKDWDAMKRPHGGTAFIEKSASLIHFTAPKGILCGTNAKYGNPEDLSDDGFAIWDDSGPIVDQIIGRNFRFFDVIANAGSPAARPAWQDLSGTTLSRGLWVQPRRVHDVDPGGGTGGGGTAPVTPTPEDLIKLLPDRGRMRWALERLHAYYKAPEGLQRPEGLWIHGAPDFEGIAAWRDDVWLRAVLSGKSDDAAFGDVVKEIRNSAEWRGLHPGETP